MMRALNDESNNSPPTLLIFVSLGAILLVFLTFLAAILNCNSDDLISLRSYLTGNVSAEREGSDAIYRNRIARDLESKKKEKEETASQRRERLLKIFHKDQVIMVSLLVDQHCSLFIKEKNVTNVLECDIIVVNSSVHQP